MPTESASSFAAFPLAFNFVAVEASVATDSTEVSPSWVGMPPPSTFDGIDTVVFPAEVEEVDFRGMTVSLSLCSREW